MVSLPSPMRKVEGNAVEGRGVWGKVIFQTRSINSKENLMIWGGAYSVIMLLGVLVDLMMRLLVFQDARNQLDAAFVETRGDVRTKGQVTISNNEPSRFVFIVIDIMFRGSG